MTGKGRFGAACRVLAVLFLAAAACRCSTAQDPGNPVNAQGEHPADFVAAHPAYAGSSAAACAPCHGDDLRGGISQVSCFSASWNGVACHASGPAFHPASWLDCTARGTNDWHATAWQDNVLVNGTPCAGCHTPPALDNVPSGFCIRCHFTISGARVPPGSAWIHGMFDGHAAFNDNATARAVCMACHDTHNRFGQPPTCHNCHEPFPVFTGHPASWLDCTARGTNGWHATAYVNNFLVEGKRCNQCHALNTKCTVCHFDIAGRKVPVSSTYIHGSLTGHGDFDADNTAWPVCVACHETHNRFGQEPACHNCH